MSVLTDELEEMIQALEVEAEGYKWDLGQANDHNHDLAKAISSAIRALDSLNEVPLGDVESSVQLIIEQLREAL